MLCGMLYVQSSKSSAYDVAGELYQFWSDFGQEEGRKKSFNGYVKSRTHYGLKYVEIARW
jgi:hypothetical protein